MKIYKSTIPPHSLLCAVSRHFDYSDSYQGTIIDKENKLTSTDLAWAFFSSSPRWAAQLMALRNKIVRSFGLKAPGNLPDSQISLKEFNCEPGARFGLFKIFGKTASEVVMGEDDKHLNFRVSLLLDNHRNDNFEKRVSISTAVTFNNKFGKLYFLPVKPFHRLIVPAMLQAMINKLELHQPTH